MRDRPRITSDNGPYFIANDCKEFIRISSIAYVKTLPFYPQSNGKIEMWYKIIKQESIRPHCPIFEKRLRSMNNRRKILWQIKELKHIWIS